MLKITTAFAYGVTICSSTNFTFSELRNMADNMVCAIGEHEGCSIAKRRYLFPANVSGSSTAKSMDFSFDIRHDSAKNEQYLGRYLNTRICKTLLDALLLSSNSDIVLQAFHD